MSEERTIAPVSSDDRIRRASSPSTSASPASASTNWLRASTWKERYLMEPIKRTSPTSTPSETSAGAAVEEESVESNQEEVPLDFSMKKRKSTSGVETRISRSPSRDDDILSSADTASPTYGLMKAFLERRASSPNRRPDADSELVPTESSSSPFCSPNRRGPSNLLLGPAGAFPLSLAAAAAVVNANSQQQNAGASAASNRRHCLTQQLLQRHDHQNQRIDDFGSNNAGDNGNRSDGLRSQSNDSSGAVGASERQIPALGACTPATPPAFFPGGIHSPQNGHQQSSTRNSQQQQKIQRPFKAYNPTDPMSALQVGAALAPSALPFLNAALAPSTMGASSPSQHLLLPNPLTSPIATTSSNALPPLLNAQILSQYRQYLINAQAAAAVAALRAKSSQHLQQQLHQPPQRQAQRQQQSRDAMTTSIASQIVSNANSQSPPQVTSTSHPHTAESSSSASSTASPPSPNHVANPNPNGSCLTGVITAQASNRIRNSSLPQTKPTNGSDRRISSGSGSGGSSFNGGDEDDEELLNEDDDGVSNRTSPTPSCASSTALRRTSVIGNGDGAGVCVIGGSDAQHGSNGSGCKAENGSNGVSSRRKGRSLPDSLKDEAYWERRRKNNEAAKRSRDARRAKEDEIAIRAALLEQENMRLRIEVAALKAETDKLRQMLLNT